MPAALRCLARLRKEPLAQFLLLGAGLFLLYRLVAPAPRRIEVDAELIAGLARDFQRRTGAPPTPAEEAALIQGYVESEALYREALALGLDRGDVIVRRRLLQKIGFLLDAAPAPEPSDEELAGLLAAHPERYAAPPRRSLVQVFVSSDRHGAAAPALAAQLLGRLRAGDDPQGLGDPFLHGTRLDRRSQTELRGIFGPEMAQALFALQEGAWTGPLRSSYGLHLVLPGPSTPGGQPPLAEVREQLRRDFQEAQRGQAQKKAVAEVLRRYQVHVAARRP